MHITDSYMIETTRPAGIWRIAVGLVVLSGVLALIIERITL